MLLVNGIANSLAFQWSDWNAPAPSEQEKPVHVGAETGLPPGADRDLVLEAQAIGGHVFLTRDRLVLRRTRLTGPPIAILSPLGLACELADAGVELFHGGTCGSPACPYGDWPIPAPDLGKWNGLMPIIDDS